MDEDEIVDRILELADADEPDELLETTAATLHADLYEAAADAFGGWDGALAAALCRAVETDTSSSRSSGGDERIVRTVGPDARDPLFAVTADNLFFKIAPGTDLPVTDSPEPVDLPPGSGPVTRLHHVGDPEGLVLFTRDGHYFALTPQMIPRWSGAEEIRRVGNVLGIDASELLEFVLPRRELYAGRIVHVTERAKGTATEASEFQYSMDHEGRVAFKLNDGDRPVAVMAVPEDTGIFAASAHGRGIHFPDDELRSMGQRAVGVNVMDLEDETDAVVGAFPSERVEQVAVVTEEGLGKRVDFDEFRQQGRAGAGMQLARLNRDDAVAGVAACRPSDDLLLSTSEGRLHRRPAADFDPMGRPAKGNPVVDLADHEEILAFTRLPCSTEST